MLIRIILISHDTWYDEIICRKYQGNLMLELFQWGALRNSGIPLKIENDVNDKDKIGNSVAKSDDSANEFECKNEYDNLKCNQCEEYFEKTVHLRRHITLSHSNVRNSLEIDLNGKESNENNCT